MNYIVPEEKSAYNYEMYSTDTIFSYKIDEELTKEVYDYATHFRKIATKEMLEYQQSLLAGDLSEEYGLDFKENIQLFKKIQNAMLINLSDIFNREIISFYTDGIWVNFQKPNECNPIHSHTGKLSLVWYLDIPEVIRQEHLNQKSNVPNRGLINFYSTFSTDVLTFNPQTSDMLIFESNHRHSVYPYKSNVERVSLSMNIKDICTFSDSYGELVYL